MKKLKNKIDWKLVGGIALLVIFAAIMVIAIILKIWVFYEYGDMPITEVPTWAIPWLTGGGN